MSIEKLSKPVGIYTPEEERGWRFLVANPLATPEDVAINADIDIVLAANLFDRVSTPREVFEAEKTAKAPPLRAQLLQRGLELTTGDRNKSYGEPYDNLHRCAQLIEAYLRAKYGTAITVTAEDVAHIMSLVKIGRSMTPGYHEDNYLDSAVYQTIAAECRLRECGE
jgi:hypothetical protein